MGTLKSFAGKLWRGFPLDTPVIVENGPQPDYRELVRSLRQVMFQTDLQGVLTFLSANWEKLTGFGVDESIGTPLTDYVHPEDRKRYQVYIASVTASIPGEGTVTTLRCVRKDGSSRWIEAHATHSATGHNPRSVTGMVGILSDITGRVRGEQLERATHRALETLIGHLPCMVYRCSNDQHWTMIYVSPGSLELTGHTPEDIINNRTLSYAQLIHTYDRQRIWNEVQTALSENRPFDLEYRIFTRQGEEKWVWERGKGILSTDGELLALEGYITDITKNKLSKRQSRQRLLYDPDTGLPNVALFMDRLQWAVRKFVGHNECCFALELLELDRFDDLQSKYGAATADNVAAETSRRLLGVLDVHSTLSRMSESRFGILLEQPRDLKATSKIVRQLQEQILLPFMIDDVEIYVTASIGVALSSTGYESGEHMLCDAATALSRAKALGGARYEVFDLHLHAKAAAQAQIEREIKDAMCNREMSVYWQPVIDLASGNLAGLEARLAWKHPRRGLLFAEHFVPGAEDTQLILPLGEYMLLEACEQMKAWQSLPGFEDVGINIEIFGRTLFDTDSIMRLGEHLLQAKPSSFSLALGIPEEVLIQRTEANEQMLDWLQAKQIRLILDSFGAGACSLSMLRRTPIDMIRIHPSLIEECEDGGPLIQAVLALAHALGISIIADRIQTERQLAIARKQNIDYAQGDLISPPLEEAHIRALLNQRQIAMETSPT
jgi:PAS domain S-box-containing protein/diguanylate cyclase (GGDEF)-like protein